MAIFRKIYPRCWHSIVGLNPVEKLIAIYILSGPQTNRCGIYFFSIGRAIEDLETLPQTFKGGFNNVIKHLSWEYDQKARVVYIPTWWKWNKPENPNVLISNLKDLDEIPKTPLLSKFYANTLYLPDNLIETFTQTLTQTIAESEEIEEEGAETETGAEEIKDLSATKVTDRQNGFKISTLAELWNDKAPPELAKVNLPFTRSPKKLKSLTAMVSLYPDREWWEKLIGKIHHSAFLKGKNDRGWKATFDFVVSKADEINDGKYIDNETDPWASAMDWARS
jgi:hypothetical protein